MIRSILIITAEICQNIMQNVNCAYKFIGKQIKDNFGENAFETDEK